MLSTIVKLSIITATYNSASSIKDTIESILIQDLDYLEYIIIDGNSKDATVSIIKQYEEKFKNKGWNFKWISEKDNGIYDAWNKGLALVSGNWISYIGSDDVYLENSLKLYYQTILANSNQDFVTAKAIIKSEGNTNRIFGSEFLWSEFRREMKILHAGGFLSKNYFDKYGIFDESYKITGDYELLLRAGSNLKVTFINDILVEMDGGGVSNTLVIESFKEARRAKLKNKSRSNTMAMCDFYFVLLKVYLKKLI